MSRWYDLIASSEGAFVEAGLEQLDAQAGEDVLEVGYGTGEALLTLARAVGASGHVHGIDLSPGMFRVAHEKLQQAGLTQHTSLICGDGARLPYPARRFDALFMSFTLELFDTPEMPHVLAECRRVLRPHGRLGVVSLTKSADPGPLVRLYEWFHRQFPAYIDCRPIPLREIVEQNGFRVRTHRRDAMWGLPVGIVIADPTHVERRTAHRTPGGIP
jgi:demethylmenaquinone methyltransferase/2-methoxy-6-polyprenyl-1,4-benzoquinol methylase